MNQGKCISGTKTSRLYIKRREKKKKKKAKAGFDFLAAILSVMYKKIFIDDIKAAN